MKKETIVAVYIQSESGDDYLFCEKGTDEEIATSILKSLGEEADYCHLRQISTLCEQEDLESKIRKLLNKKLGQF